MAPRKKQKRQESSDSESELVESKTLSKSPTIYNRLTNGFYQSIIIMILCSSGSCNGKIGKFSHALKSKIMFLAIVFDLGENARIDFWNTTQATSLYSSFRILFICEYFKTFLDSFRPVTTHLSKIVLDGFNTKSIIEDWFMPSKSKRYNTKLPKYVSNCSILKTFSDVDISFVEEFSHHLDTLDISKFAKISKTDFNTVLSGAKTVCAELIEIMKSPDRFNREIINYSFREDIAPFIKTESSMAVPEVLEDASLEVLEPFIKEHVRRLVLMEEPNIRVSPPAKKLRKNFETACGVVQKPCSSSFNASMCSNVSDDSNNFQSVKSPIIEEMLKSVENVTDGDKNSIVPILRAIINEIKTTRSTTQGLFKNMESKFSNIISKNIFSRESSYEQISCPRSIPPIDDISNPLSLFHKHF